MWAICGHVTATCELQPCRSLNVHKLRVSGWLPVKWRHLRITSGHMWSRQVFICHVAVTSCELQPCRISNVLKTRASSLIQPLPGDFRWNDVTCGSLLVTCGHMTSFLSCDCHFLQVTALQELKCTRSTSSGLIQSLPGDFRWNDVTSGSHSITLGHRTWLPVTWLPSLASYSPVGAQTYQKRTFSAFYSHFRETSGEMTSLPGHFRSRGVTWHHFL